MTEFNKLSIAQALLSLKKGEISVTELVESHLMAMKKFENLNSYVLTTSELALKKAAILDSKYLKKENLGILAGIPVGVKDLYCTKNIRTTSCSKMLADFVPEYESTVTEKLFAQDAIMLGKTNMDEFAMGSSNETSYFGPVVNPWKNKNTDEEVVAGGSSGGSAASTAGFLNMASLGSDTGGSVRLPASFCGIVGLKPTYGRCSRYGMIAFSSSLDQAGVFARNIEDTALVTQAIMGHDPKDSTCSPQPIPDLISNLNNLSLKGLRIGIPKEYNISEIPQEIKNLWQQAKEFLSKEGAEIIDITLPNTQHALPVYYIIAPAEASSNLSRFDGLRYGLRVEGNSLDEMYELTRAAGFGDEVKRRIMIGAYVLSSSQYDKTYLHAQRVRHLIINDFKDAFKKVDVILTPTSISEAFSASKKLTPLEMYHNDIFTIPASLAGLPCLSLPAGLSSNGLPLGLQLITNSFEEVKMLQIGQFLEKSFKFKACPEGY